MVDKHFSFAYSFLLSLCISIMMILMILLFLEYRFFCQQAREMVELKQQYALYVDVLTKKINGNEIDDVETIVSAGELVDEILEEGDEESAMSMEEILKAEASDAPDDDDDYVDDSFVVINRQPEYLKQSTLDYMQTEELNSLMTAIDIDRWSDYTESSFAKAPSDRLKDRQSAILTQKSNAPKKRITKSVSKPKTHTTAHRPLKDCGFIWPIDADKFWLSSLFGPRKRVDGTWGFHHGIDLAAVKGTLVKVVRAGTVVEACFQTGYGNTVVVQHSDALKTRYAHLHTIRAYVGQKVKQGAIVGTVGETGFIRKKGKDGSHLHFEVYEKGKRVNPMHCLSRTV
jgi:murein DD-endopeptidase MepM/ murein hydrolase activator NlpD